MHIHPNSPNSFTSLQSEESAAITIQAGFRGYRVRKQLCQRHSINGYRHLQHRRFGSHRRIQRQYRQSIDNSIRMPSDGSNNGVSLSTSQLCYEHRSGSEGSSVEDRCATKIQAGVRGFLVRKKQKIASDAATKIQAGFRGFKVRKETQKLKQK